MKSRRQLLFRLLLLIGVAAGVEAVLYANQDSSETAAPSAEIQAHGHAHGQPPTLEVKHSLQQDDLHLQLTVQHFSFSLENMGKDNKAGEGHVHLYLDGKKVAKVFEPTYVLKDIPPGKHEVTVELAKNNHESYGVQQKFQIEIKP
jgi:hypothetical protein